MTKRKTQPFHGGWMDETLTGGVPLSRFAAVEIARKHAEAEADAQRRISDRIRAEPGRISPKPVIAVLRVQLGIWRFNRKRIDRDPEAAQWAGLMRKVVVPESPDFNQVSELQSAVRKLPAQVIGMLNAVLFQRGQVGVTDLLQRMIDAAMPTGGRAAESDAALLRDALAAMIATPPKAKQGPRADAGPMFRALVAVISESAVESVLVRDVHALAADLLRDCGVKVPQSRQELSRLAR